MELIPPPDVVAPGSGKSKMRYHPFIAAGLGLALTMAILADELKISATPAWSASDPALQSISRTLKGDRSPLLPARTGDRIATSFPGDTVVVPELLDGCEPVISSIGDSPLARWREVVSLRLIIEPRERSPLGQRPAVPGASKVATLPASRHRSRLGHCCRPSSC